MIRDNSQFDYLDKFKNLTLDDLDTLLSDPTKGPFCLEKLGEIAERASKIAKIAGNQVSTAFFGVKDTRNQIFSYLMPVSKSFNELSARKLMHVGFTSKLFLKEVKIIKNKWIQRNFLNLTDFGIRNFDQQLEYFAENNFTKLNVCYHRVQEPLKQLPQLNIQSLAISPEYCTFLPILDSLEELLLVTPYYVGNETHHIPAITANFSNLKKLTISVAAYIDFKTLFNGSNSLEEIQLISSRIGEADLIGIANACKGLRKFRLNNTRDKIHNGINAIITENLNLRKINLENTYVTDLILPDLAKCIKLQKLNLNFTRVSEKGILELTKSCVELEEIGLVGLRITDAGLIDIAKACKNLRKIWVRCTLVTTSGITELKKIHPNIIVVL